MMTISLFIYVQNVLKEVWLKWKEVKMIGRRNMTTRSSVTVAHNPHKVKVGKCNSSLRDSPRCPECNYPLVKIHRVAHYWRCPKCRHKCSLKVVRYEK